MSDQNTNLARAFYSTLMEMEQKLIAEKEASAKIAHKTGLYVKSVLVLFFITFLYLFYQAFALSNDIKMLGQDMVLMYNQFGEMQEEMNIMTKSVTHMSNNVKSMVPMSAEMNKMVGSMETMHKNVSIMTNDVILMEKNLLSITSGMNEMTGRFVHLNGTVNYMRYNVFEMAEPVRDLPFP